MKRLLKPQNIKTNGYFSALSAIGVQLMVYIAY